MFQCSARKLALRYNFCKGLVKACPMNEAVGRQDWKQTYPVKVYVLINIKLFSLTVQVRPLVPISNV